MSEAEPKVLYEKKGQIAYITINRPEVLNALDPETDMGLYEAFCDFRDDPSLVVAIYTANGRAFCAGYDLEYWNTHGSKRPSPSAPAGGIAPRDGDLPFECWKPIICAVNGPAYGGAEVVFACDIIVASTAAVLALPEVRVGLVPGAGSLHRLPAQVGLRRALDILLTGRAIPADEALELGLVNEVVEPDDLIAAAERWAEQILKGAPLAIYATKQATWQGIGQPYEVAHRQRYDLLSAAKASSDASEGPLAFMERRDPVWSGTTEWTGAEPDGPLSGYINQAPGTAAPGSAEVEQ